MEKTPAVYILANHKSGTIYIGVTSQPIGRWWQHRVGVINGFTRRYGVHRLVHVEFFGAMEPTILREKQLKRWHRAWKINLIEAGNPQWRSGAGLRTGAGRSRLRRATGGWTLTDGRVTGR
jgi:putative endonuclease